MKSFYVKVTPLRLGFTGYEPFGAYLARMRQQSLTTCDFTGAITTPKGQEFGLLTGSGDDLAEILEITESIFNIKRITKEEFIGACYKYYHPNPIEGMEAPTLSQLLVPFGIVLDNFDTVACCKAFKRNLFKEISKKLFPDDNDSISNLARGMLTIVSYYPSMNTTEKAAVDSLITRIKAIYTKDISLEGLNQLTSDIEKYLTGYYMAVANLNSKTTEADVLAVEYN